MSIKLMRKKLVVKKDNALVAAAYTLNLAEKRMILLASALANESDPVNGLIIRADQYAETYSVTKEAGYNALQKACETLFERRVTIYKNNEKTVTRWISFITYKEGLGEVEIGFSTKVIPFLNELKNNYTFFGIEQIARLTSVHAIRLYELLIQWRSTGKTPVIDLAKFRGQLGIGPDEYPRMTNFKQRVLDPALKQINTYTDITAKYEQHKKGRSISGFSFTFTQKNAVKTAITKPKRTQITRKEAEKEGRPGEEWHDLVKRLSTEYHIKN